MEHEQNGQAPQDDGQNGAANGADAPSKGGEGEGYTPPRDTSGRFLPGYSGNPQGRPKGSISFRTRLRRQLKENPQVMADIIRRLLLDSEVDSKVALQVAQWHDGENPDAFDKEQELSAMEASSSPEDVLGACLAALRTAGLHEMADRLQTGADGGSQ